MKKLTLLVLALLSVAPLSVKAADAPAETAVPARSLEEQLNSLGTPGNEAPVGLTSEQLYAVQNRYAVLKHRHEISLGGGNNFSSSSFLASQGFDATYRFYLTDRWFLGLNGSLVFNEYSRDGQGLVDKNSIVPDVGVTKYRADLLVGYNLFYGKFRLTMDKVFYFDQYVGIGPGVVWLQTGRRAAAVGDVGFAFWFGRNFSFRIGVKDYFFDEQRLVSHGLVHNFVGYLQAGYVFGG